MVDVSDSNDVEFYLRVLQFIGVDKYRVSGNKIQARCPFDGHVNGRDIKPSLSIDIETGLWYCFGCGRRGKSLRGLVYQWAVMNGMDYENLRDRLFGLGYLKERVQRVQNSQYEFGVELSKAIKQNSSNGVAEDDPRVLEEVVKYADSTKGSVPKYILNRGVSLEVAREAMLGYDRVKRRVVFPVRRMEDGAVVGVITRGLNSKGDYLYNPGFRRSRYLYLEYEVGTNPLGGGLILVEGPIDALVARGYGANAVALMGSELADGQAEKILRLCEILKNNEVIVMMDADDPGRRAAERIEKKLTSLPLLIRVVDLGAGDPADIKSGEEFWSKIEETKKKGKGGEENGNSK